jgi:hypothetical protein
VPAASALRGPPVADVLCGCRRIGAPIIVSSSKRSGLQIPPQASSVALSHAGAQIDGPRCRGHRYVGVRLAPRVEGGSGRINNGGEELDEVNFANAGMVATISVALLFLLFGSAGSPRFPLSPNPT